MCCVVTRREKFFPIRKKKISNIFKTKIDSWRNDTNLLLILNQICHRNAIHIPKYSFTIQQKWLNSTCSHVKNRKFATTETEKKMWKSMNRRTKEPYYFPDKFSFHTIHTWKYFFLVLAHQYTHFYTDVFITFSSLFFSSSSFIVTWTMCVTTPIRIQHLCHCQQSASSDNTINCHSKWIGWNKLKSIRFW